jgi:hypothetical protein
MDVVGKLMEHNTYELLNGVEGIWGLGRAETNKDFGPSIHIYRRKVMNVYVWLGFCGLKLT